MAKFLRVNMPDAYYDIPIEVIAVHRAARYADEYDDDVERSLAEDTMPLFESNPGEVAEHAVSEMNWSDVVTHAERVEKPTVAVDYEAEWLRCGRKVIER